MGEDFRSGMFAPFPFAEFRWRHDPMLEAVWGVGGVDSRMVAGGGDDGWRTERAGHVRGGGVHGEDQSRGGDGF